MFSPAKKALEEYLKLRSAEGERKALRSDGDSTYKEDEDKKRGERRNITGTNPTVPGYIKGFNILELFKFNASEILRGEIRELRELAMSNNEVPNSVTPSGIPLNLTGPTIYDYIVNNIPEGGTGLQPAGYTGFVQKAKAGSGVPQAGSGTEAETGTQPEIENPQQVLPETGPLITEPPVNTSTSSNVPTSNVVPPNTPSNENPNLVVEPPQSNPTQPPNPPPDETVQYSIPE